MGIKFIELGCIRRILEKNGFCLHSKKPLRYDIRPVNWRDKNENSAVASLLVKPAKNLIIVTEKWGDESIQSLTSEALRKWLPVKRQLLEALEETDLEVIVVTTDDNTD